MAETYARGALSVNRQANPHWTGRGSQSGRLRLEELFEPPV